MTYNSQNHGMILNLGLYLVLLLGLPSVALPGIIPGQVLVKFASESEGGIAVVTAIQTDPADLTALGAATADLQTKTGVFLKPTKITADQRVIFSIDVNLLMNDLELRLHKRRNVETVQLKTQTLSTKTHVSAPKKLLVAFIEGSPESESLQQQQANHQDRGFATLIPELEKDLKLPLVAEVTQEGEFLLWVDLQKLTMTLVEQLNPLPEIESAQPNYVLTIQ